MKEYIIPYTKTRNGQKVYFTTLEAQDRKEAITLFYSFYPRFHIRGRIMEK